MADIMNRPEAPGMCTTKVIEYLLFFESESLVQMNSPSCEATGRRGSRAETSRQPNPAPASLWSGVETRAGGDMHTNHYGRSRGLFKQIFHTVVTLASASM
jgi:hypothetical protein